MKTLLKLNDGNEMPVLGLGTWKADKNLVGEAVRFALTRVGYKHIDCASIYQNEPEIGEVFKGVIGKSLKRDELFITSKLWNTKHHPQDVEKACRKTLSDLKIKYLDLYLMHWGIALDEKGNLLKVSIQQTWTAMERLVKKGLVKSIGVSNFTAIMIVDLLTYAKIKPVMNQVELHPYLTQEALVAFCQEKKIALTAYSPLGNPGLVGDSGPSLFKEPIIKKLSKKYNKTPAQILINWALGRGVATIPKSLHGERITENIDVFDFELDRNEEAEIASLDRNYRIVNPKDWWGVPYFP